MDADSDSGSSGLSSPPSRSPSPPASFYPSPPSSQYLPGDSPPAIAVESLPESAERDGPPPAKKRRVTEPKPRTTEYLDLRSPYEPQDASQKAQLDLLLKVLRKKRKIVVIAGAGISVSAGIPDFRSSTGLFTTLRSQHNLKASGKHLFDASVYRTGSSTSSFHDMVRSLSQLISNARPTAFHHLLASLAHQGRLMRLYSQNVDGIDTSLPPLATAIPLTPKGPWPRTIQLHGGLEKMVCQKCSHLSDFNAALFEGPDPPSCTACEELDSVRTTIAGKRSHGIGKLRPRIVLYNEYNPDEEAIGAVTTADLRSRPDAVIVVGTSLKVPGVKRIVREMCGVVRGRRDGVAIWINNGPEPSGKEFENCWDLVVRGSCEDVADHAAMLKWDQTDDLGEYKECSSAEVKKVKSEAGGIEVVVQRSSKPEGFKPDKGVLTPVGSPRLQSAVTDAADKVAVKPIVEPDAQTIEVATNTNPASKGVSISKLLKKQPKTSGTSKPRKKPAKKSSSASFVKSAGAKINNAFRVTKSTTAKSSTTKPASKPAAVSVPKTKPDPPSTSTNKARTQTRKPISTFPNMGKFALPRMVSSAATATTVGPSTPAAKAEKENHQLRDAIVSPTGSLPASLAKIMNA
ncbi:MAG: hypothetical protein M1819_000221 [Sarea resinae]|nr:MAG: hypothetical protein M1819_000221 [Sarea resinae]